MQTIINAGGATFPNFQSAGFDVPRNLVDVNGKPVLQRAIEAYSVDTSRTCVSLLDAEDRQFGTSQVIKRVLPELRFALLPHETKGALISALFAVEGFEIDQPLVLASGDSEIRDGLLNYLDEWLSSKVDAATLGFKSSDPRWSYVQLDSEGKVSQVAEKQVIGNFATTGVFYFKTVKLFLNAATWCLVNNSQTSNQFYSSVTLNHVIYSGGKVALSEIPASSYKCWSTPADLLNKDN